MWAVLLLAVVALLVIGSNHPQRLTPDARIANLEGILKCPSCANASLAQSETVGANDLKAIVRKWVDQGLSDQTIESRLVATYGPNELLRPTNWALWIVPAAVILVACLLLVWFFLRRRPTETEPGETDEERVFALLQAMTFSSEDGRGEA